MATGTPERFAADPASHTGRFLAEVLERPSLPLDDAEPAATGARVSGTTLARLTKLARIPADVSKRLLIIAVRRWPC